MLLMLLLQLFNINRGHPFTFIYPILAGFLGAPQMTSQPVSSISLSSPLPSWTWWTQGLSIPWYCLPTSSSVCLVFFPLSLCLARRFWQDLMNGRHVHTIAVCVTLRWSGGLHVVRLPAGSWHKLVTWSLYEMRSTLRQHLTSMEIDSVNEDGPALVYIDARVYPLSLTYPQCIKIQPNIKTNHSSFLLLNLATPNVIAA